MSLIEQFQFNFLDDNRWQFILSGLKNTIIITFFAVLLGIFLGFVIAIVRSTHDKTGKLKILNVICQCLSDCDPRYTNDGTAADRIIMLFLQP